MDYTFIAPAPAGLLKKTVSEIHRIPYFAGTIRVSLAKAGIIQRLAKDCKIKLVCKR